jgi:hypothetical protein
MPRLVEGDRGEVRREDPVRGGRLTRGRLVGDQALAGERQQ